MPDMPALVNILEPKMYRMLTFAALSLTAVACTLATPETSRADSPFGIRFRIGDFSFGYRQGYPSYDSGYYQQPFYGQSFYPNYGQSFYPNHWRSHQSVIVQPTHSHWTPYRGWHTHGNVIYPRGPGYIVRPY